MYTAILGGRDIKPSKFSLPEEIKALYADFCQQSCRLIGKCKLNPSVIPVVQRRHFVPHFTREVWGPSPTLSLCSRFLKLHVAQLDEKQFRTIELRICRLDTVPAVTNTSFQSMSKPEIYRQQAYYASGDETLFGWLHGVPSESSPPACVVICNPLGFEYMSGYRTIRHLADHVARRGTPALRFDYAFTGNSSGEDFKSASIMQIESDILASVAYMRRVFGQCEVTIVGIGLGATFGVLASRNIEQHRLVLWNPTIRGKRYIRELRLLSNVLDQSTTKSSDHVDAAGVYLSDSFQIELADINLTQCHFDKTKSALLIDREDIGDSSALLTTFETLGLEHDYVKMAGYKEMMDVPTDTVVPESTIDRIAHWIQNATPDPKRSATMDIVDARPSTCHKAILDGVTERAEFFSPNGNLFGVVSQPTKIDKNDKEKTAVVFINCGSEHNVGPQRLYTTIARQLAKSGFITFRFDLEGIGDSMPAGNNLENVPYSPTALKDIEQALAHLTETYACGSFILTGVCAGAFHSFKAAISIETFAISEAILINPLVFEWRHDRTSDEVRYEMNHYRSSMKTPQKWLKLLSGNVSVLHLSNIVFQSISNRVRRVATRLWNFVRSIPNTDLPEDLDRLRAMGRHLTIIYADSDPAHYIMMTQAKRQTVRGEKSGLIKIHPIANADHAFSKRSMRNELIEFFSLKFSAPHLETNSKNPKSGIT